MSAKPIRIFYSTMTGRFYATQYYKQQDNGNVEVTGKKYDVTDNIANLIKDYEIEFIEKHA